MLQQGIFNYFSRTYGMPLDTTEATRALLEGMIRPVHVSLHNGCVFLVTVSLGLYPQLLEDREVYKQQFGCHRPVALWAGVVTLLRAHRHLYLSQSTTKKARTTKERNASCRCLPGASLIASFMVTYGYGAFYQNECT
jgi:diacylglycerol kinase family enzyme